MREKKSCRGPIRGEPNGTEAGRGGERADITEAGTITDRTSAAGLSVIRAVEYIPSNMDYSMDPVKGY